MTDEVVTIPLWKRLLDPAGQPADHYQDYVHTPLFDLIEGTPRRVLDLGCAAGAFGAALKLRFPDAQVVGIEAAHAAAAVAAQRLDRVIEASLDGIDLAAHGLAPGEFDLAIASDVLEHLVNPWDLLVRLEPFLAPGAQVVASIPNARNITVAGLLLSEGEFRYEERGLLDITHLRFFTWKSTVQLFEETGYRVEQHQGVIAPKLAGVWREYQGRTVPVIKMGRVALQNVTPQDLFELCTLQFVVRARRA